MRKPSFFVTLSIVLSVVALFLSPAQFPVSAEEPANTPALLFAVPAGETFAMQFSAPASFATDAWVGIVASNVPHGSEAQNDQYDLGRVQLNGITSGLLRFAAPPNPGLYDLRMHDTDNDGKEVASFTFVVLEPPPQAARLWLDKPAWSPGTEVQVHFAAPPGLPEDAWVGLIPSGAPHGSGDQNDQYDVAYQYLEGQTAGVLVFQAPGQPGSYDFRMNDKGNGGAEIASVTFTVTAPVAGESKLWLERTTFAPGEEIQVNFSTPSTYATTAWVGIVPSDVPHGSSATNDEHDVNYAYLDGQTSGVLTFQAPEQPGNYDFRLHDTSDNGSEVASVSFTVGG